MHTLQARLSWARTSRPLSRCSGSASLRHLTRPGIVYNGVVCSQDFHPHDRDRPAARPFDDPHQTPPPRPAAAAAHQHHAVQPPQPPPEPSLELPSSLSTSDLEFGADALTGSTLETPEQLAHKYRHPHQRQQERERQERLHQADIAREAAEDSVDDALFMSAREVEDARLEDARLEDARLEEEAAAARRALAAGESTAAEREDRYAGILQAMDSLGTRGSCGASDDEGQAVSPEAARLATAGSVDNEEEAAFDTLRHTVDMLGEGEEAAELIMESYKGRNLEAEALSTMDPADTMPHPGDRYLRPSAASGRGAPPSGMEARLDGLHSRLEVEQRCGPLRPPARRVPGNQGQQFGSRCRGGASAWMPPEDSQEAARPGHNPVGESEALDVASVHQAGREASPAAAAGRAAASTADDQIELQEAWRHAGPVGADPAGSAAGTADDQIDFEQDALRGADALYYAPEHAAAVNSAPAGGRAGASSSGVIEAPEEVYDVDRDALRGSDAMFYFSFPPGPGPARGREGRGSGSQAGEGRKETEQGTGQEEADTATVWGALSSRDEQHSGFRRAMEDADSKSDGKQAERGMERLAQRLHHNREPNKPRPPPAARVFETAMGRSAALGLGAALFSEVLTQQSVASQMLGRFEGLNQIEVARSSSQAAALTVLAAAVVLTIAERLSGTGAVPHWRPLGLAPTTQVWLGRGAMILFALLLAYETMHSNRPAFGTLFYLWP
ncbi:hypothetical protein ABPG77_001242 [Micractinium sp. CCAP 211/92]